MDESIQEHLVELDDASRLLLRAAALIEERGLAKHVQQDGRGRLCLIGALVRAHTGEFTPGDVFGPPGLADELLPTLKRVARALDCHPACVHLWNNAPKRTQAEVVAKLRAVALGSR